MEHGKIVNESQWVFKTKNEASIIRFKVRLVAKGNSQRYGID